MQEHKTRDLIVCRYLLMSSGVSLAIRVQFHSNCVVTYIFHLFFFGAFQHKLNVCARMVCALGIIYLAYHQLIELVSLCLNKLREPSYLYKIGQTEQNLSTNFHEFDASVSYQTEQRNVKRKTRIWISGIRSSRSSCMT